MLPVRAGRTTSAVSPARRPLRRSVDHRHRFPARAQTLTRAHSAGDMRDCFGHVPFHAFDAPACLLANLFVNEAVEPVRHEDSSRDWKNVGKGKRRYVRVALRGGADIKK